MANYDRTRIGRIMSDIDRYFLDLESMNIKTASELKDVRNYYASSMLVFQIISKTIKLAQEVITANNFNIPATYKDSFYVLSNKDFIRRVLCDELKSLVEYRNLLAHDYEKATNEDIIDSIKKLIFAREFIKRVKKEMSK